MARDLRASVVENINQLKKAISKKSSEVAHLEKELRRYESILALLAGKDIAKERNGKARRSGRTSLLAMLAQLPETFTSKDFVKVGVRTNRPPLYLRQVLSRWAREGKIKRLQRGKYQKLKKAAAQRAAA
ncbi:MAG TPA: hypothetical protein VNN77_09535 [candidate division Zixibacteria bacterium]|nr:hypothetical protein [candidate division Zixibacteria bacterium]